MADNERQVVEQTAADIRRLLAAGKCRCRDITVAARNMTEYAGTIETVFERYGIPVYLSRRSDILEKPVLSLLTGVLSSITPSSDRSSASVLAAKFQVGFVSPRNVSVARSGAGAGIDCRQFAGLGLGICGVRR